MAKMDPIVKQETLPIAVWVLIGCLLTQGVCLIVGWWNLPILLGNVLGGVTAVGNFFLMCLTVTKALEKDKDKAAKAIRLSQSGRLMMQGAVLIIAGVLPTVFNLWAAIIPLIIPTVAVRVRHLILAKKSPSPDRPAVGWDDEDDED